MKKKKNSKEWLFEFEEAMKMFHAKMGAGDRKSDPNWHCNVMMYIMAAEHYLGNAIDELKRELK